MSDPSSSAAAGGRRLVGGRVALAVARRPGLWVALARLAYRSAAANWWRHWPPLPLPPPEYVAFRIHTALGASPDEKLSPADVVDYLEWCQRMERSRTGA